MGRGSKRWRCCFSREGWGGRRLFPYPWSAGNTNDTSQSHGGTTMITRALVCVALCGLLASGSLLAHHSLAGVYDMDKESELTGLVESIRFVNPHGSLIILAQKEDGTSVKWTFMLGSATRLAQRGIGPTGQNALHQGDKITVKFIPARNGDPLGFLTSVKMPDGRVLNISSGNPND